jgi:hypothetical protein
VETCRNGGSHEAAIAGLREDPVRDEWVRRGRAARFWLNPYPSLRVRSYCHDCHQPDRP